MFLSASSPHVCLTLQPYCLGTLGGGREGGRVEMWWRIFVRIARLYLADQAPSCVQQRFCTRWSCSLRLDAGLCAACVCTPSVLHV